MINYPNVLILGIDPGLTGAVVVIEIDVNIKQIVHVKFIDIPLVMKASGKNVLDCAELVQELNDVLQPYVTFEKYAFVENVHSMPRQGVVGAFTFGKTVGILHGVITALHIPLFDITPQKWKKQFSLIKCEKDDARKYVIKNYPFLEDQLKLKKHVDKADAFLIAVCGATHIGVL